MSWPAWRGFLRPGFLQDLRCPACGGAFALEPRSHHGTSIDEGALSCPCGNVFPIIGGVPRILPPEREASLLAEHPAFFRSYPDLAPRSRSPQRSTGARTQAAFGDEWNRFPEVLAVHEEIFRWYFSVPVAWPQLRVLDAGCGMGRWLHFARRAGARVVGMDVSRAIDAAARNEGDAADFVQADLTWPPFPASHFDLVYSLGVIHHPQDPAGAVACLGRLVRPGGQLRLYVYRSLEGEPWLRRVLLACVTRLRSVTTRLPYPVVHAVAIAVASVATMLFLAPRRLLRRWPLGNRLTGGLPLTQYTDVPFRMLVAEQFDRLVAPLEGRFNREQVSEWLSAAGLEVDAVQPELGWRAIATRPR